MNSNSIFREAIGSLNEHLHKIVLEKYSLVAALDFGLCLNSKTFWGAFLFSSFYF